MGDSAVAISTASFFMRMSASLWGFTTLGGVDVTLTGAALVPFITEDPMAARGFTLLVFDAP